MYFLIWNKDPGEFGEWSCSSIEEFETKDELKKFIEALKKKYGYNLIIDVIEGVKTSEWDSGNENLY